MKVKLLNDGGYGDMENVKFPALVDATCDCRCAFVTTEELYRIGATEGCFEDGNSWSFLIGSECMLEARK